jgi:hypothetical protein
MFLQIVIEMYYFFQAFNFGSKLMSISHKAPCYSLTITN